MSELNQQPSIEDELTQMMEKAKAEAEAARRNDLLSQIAAEDIENEKKDKQKKAKSQVSFSKLFTIALMRGTLFYDTVKHQYANIFHILGKVWSILMALFYLGGISALIVFCYTYWKYPMFIQSYFQANNIRLADYQLNSYTLSRIELEDLKDALGAYEIKKATIRSDFSDFLNKRIKSVTLDGVKLLMYEKDDKFEIGKLGEILVRLNRAAQDGYQVGSVSISNATLVIRGEKYELPIQFSMTGFYERNTSISVSLKIKEPYMNVSGMLSISGKDNELNWTLDNLTGNLSFPNKQPENISAQFNLKSKALDFKEINGSVSFAYGKNKKTITIDLKKPKNVFTGLIGLSLLNQEGSTDSGETKTELSLNFEGLKINNISQIESTQPIRFNLQSFATQGFSLSNASGVLHGQLSCKNFACSYQIDKNVPVNIQSLKTVYQGYSYSSRGRIGFTLTPDKRKNLSFDGNTAAIDFTLSDFNFNGIRNSTSSEIQLSAKKAIVFGKLGEKNNQSRISLTASGTDYSSNDTHIKNASVSIADIWQETPDFNLTAKEVTLKSVQLIKVPFGLSMVRKNNMIEANLSLLNEKVLVKFNGMANLLGGTFQGLFSVKPFIIQNTTKNLNAISDLFPNNLQKVTGTVALYGKINWRNEKQINGPFYLSLENVGFTLANSTVKNLNTVLVVQSLAPFVSAPNQEAFIGEISNIMLLNNIYASVKFENQMLRLSSLTGQAGGINLTIENSLIPYRANSTVLYLKNPDADLEKVNPYLAVKGLQLKGSAQITLPIEVRQNALAMNSSEIKFNSAALSYTGSDPQIKESLFENANEYFIRSGNILLSQSSPETLDAYINLDGRLLSAQGKHSYKETISVEPKKLLFPMRIDPVPESIKQKQEQIKHAAGD